MCTPVYDTQSYTVRMYVSYNLSKYCRNYMVLEPLQENLKLISSVLVVCGTNDIQSASVGPASLYVCKGKTLKASDFVE